MPRPIFAGPKMPRPIFARPKRPAGGGNPGKAIVLAAGPKVGAQTGQAEHLGLSRGWSGSVSTEEG